MEPNAANGILLEGKISAILDQVTWELQDPPFEAWQAGAPHNAIRAIRSQDSAMGDTSNLGMIWNRVVIDEIVVIRIRCNEIVTMIYQKWKSVCWPFIVLESSEIWNILELEVPLAIMPFPPVPSVPSDVVSSSSWKLLKTKAVKAGSVDGQISGKPGNVVN